MKNSNDKPPGRPPLPPDQAATHLVKIRVTPGTKARWVRAARGQGLSEFCREAIEVKAGAAGFPARQPG